MLFLRDKHFLLLLVACDLIVILAFLYFFTPLWPWGPSHVHILDPDGEANLPAWYSSSKLLLAGAGLVLSGWRARSPLLLGAAALAVGMSADETAGIHELGGYLLSLRLPGSWQLFGHPSPHMWPYIYGIPVVMATTVVLYLLCRLDKVVSRPTTCRLFASFVVFFCGAIGVELLQQWLPPQHQPVLFGAVPLWMLVEESVENLGSSLLLWTTLVVVREMGASPV